jgi:hypothetical protein
MANIKLLFCDSDGGKSLEVFHNNQNEVTLWVEQENDYPIAFSFDKSTAAKLVKKLKLEISKIDNFEFETLSKPF